MVQLTLNDQDAQRLSFFLSHAIYNFDFSTMIVHDAERKKIISCLAQLELTLYSLVPPQPVNFLYKPQALKI